MHALCMRDGVRSGALASLLIRCSAPILPLCSVSGRRELLAVAGILPWTDKGGHVTCSRIESRLR
jgi:hypothetical protein